MIDETLVNAFNDCINRLAAGQRVEDCLHAYPEYAEQLAPMLEAGRLAIRAQVDAAEIARAQARMRSRFERALQTPPVQRAYPVRQLVALAATFLLVFGFLVSSTVVAAQDSLPGDLLYPVKRWSEEARLILSADDEPLRVEFRQRRIDETRELLALQREVEVTFEGEITATEDGNWQIAGFAVQIEPGTQGATRLQDGHQVQVRAMTTAHGSLVVLSLHPPNPSGPPDVPFSTPLPTITASPTHTATPEPTLTSTRTRTPSPTLTRTRTPTLSPTRRATPSPTMTATITPVPATQPGHTQQGEVNGNSGNGPGSGEPGDAGSPGDSGNQENRSDNTPNAPGSGGE